MWQPMSSPVTEALRSCRVLLSLLVVLVVFGVGAGWYHVSGRASVKTTDGGLKVMVGQRSDAGMRAGLRTKITKVGQCIGLGGDLTIWPHGTEVLPGNQIRVGETAYGLGDTYQGGGGVWEQNSGDFDPSEVDAPTGCPVTDALIVLAPQ
jgi:hypothetical protein